MNKDEKNEFIKYNEEQFPIRWKRMKWIKELERKYIIDGYQTAAHVIALYQSAGIAYVYRSFFGAILSICATLDAFLSY